MKDSLSVIRRARGKEMTLQIRQTSVLKKTKEDMQGEKSSQFKLKKGDNLKTLLCHLMQEKVSRWPELPRFGILFPSDVGSKS